MKKKLLTLLLVILFSSLGADQKIEELKQRVCRALPNLEGWCSREKALNFIDLVIETNPKVCVEIGVFGGASLFPVASALITLGEGVIIGIDPWDKVECIKYFDPVEDQADLQWWGKLNLNYVHNSYLKILKTYGLEKCVITKMMTSEKAAADIEMIDILHIDGNHSEIAFTQDVTTYLPKVRSGGYIWLNDALWESAQMAVDLLLESCEVIKAIDSGNCVLFKKQ